MRTRSFGSLICLTGAGVVALTVTAPQTPSGQNKEACVSVTLKALSSDLLAAKDDQARLDSIKKIAGLGEGDAVKFLLDYFKDLPLPQPSTNPYGDYFRAKALDVILPVLSEREREGFLVAVIRREADGLREAASFRAENMYPGMVWGKALEALRQGGASAETWRELAVMSDDRSVPERMRVEVKTSLTLKDTGKDDAAISKKIRAIIDELPIRPMTSIIPYDIYYDKEKRVAYGKSKLNNENGLEFIRWRDSGKLAEYETSMRVLMSYGIASVREIVAVLRRDDMSKERRDCLAMVASLVLARLSANMKRDGEQVGEECRLLVTSLANYVDQMDDPGVFSFRYRAEIGLLVFCNNTGMDEFHFSSGRQEGRLDTPPVTESASPGGNGKSLPEATAGKLPRE